MVGKLLKRIFLDDFTLFAGKSSNSTGKIIGGIIGGVAGVALCILGVFLWVQHKNNERGEQLK